MRYLILTSAVLFSMFGSLDVGHAQQLNTVPFRQDYYERQTFNEGFTQGLAKWQTKSVTPQGIAVVDWNSLPDNPVNDSSINRKFLTNPNDGRLDQVVKISGSNGLWQYAPVTGAAKFQVACCNARKRLIPGQSGEMGWAGFGVIYFDAAWQEVGRVEQQIFDFKLDPFGLGESLSQNAIGAAVPPNAFHSILWLANDGANTELWADDLILLNEFIGLPLEDRTQPFGSRLRQNPAETSLIANNYFNGLITFDDVDVTDDFNEPGRSLNTNAAFHWEGAGDVRGNVMYTEAAYWQIVDLLPNRTYDLTLAYRNQGPSVMGIDFYDENWKPIGKVDKPLEGVVDTEIELLPCSQDTRRFTAPPGTKHATVFIWVAPGDRSSLVIVQSSLRPVP